MIGSMVSHYQVECLLGRGGMGVVYRARDVRLDRWVALKFPSEEVLSESESLELFRREARTASALNHPNICTIYDVGDHEERPFIVMELLQGHPLREFIAGRPLAVEQIYRFACEIADALVQAHTRGILHRDINPSNIFITADGRAKLLDFGLAQIAHSIRLFDTTVPTSPKLVLTGPGIVAGTVAYMSPEQARGEPLDIRTDLYSLGAAIYEMASGRPAFHGATLAIVFDAILNRPPRPLRELRSDLPDSLVQIVDKLLAKQPAMRYSTGTELLHDLRERAASPPAIPPGSLSSVPRLLPSLAVLPFRNLSADPANEYFSDGITEEIISTLRQLPGLRVAARTSCFAFKDKSPELIEVGFKLNVAVVLSGSVRISGTRLRLTVELVNISDGLTLWADRFDRQTTDVFKIQDEIAGTIAAKLKLTLIPEINEPLVRPPTLNFLAYELYLRGRVLLTQRTGVARAIDHFHGAIAHDPRFALAFAGLAEAHMLLGFYGFHPAGEAMPAARDAALRALEIDGSLADPHVALGVVHWLYDWDYAQARAHFETAITANPSLAWTYVWYSIYLACTEGRFPEAVQAARRSVELDPLSGTALTALAWVHYCAGSYRESESAARHALDIEPILWTAGRVLGVTLAAVGRQAEALDCLQTTAQMSHRHPWVLVNLAEVLRLNGQNGAAEDICKEIIKRAAGGFVQPLFLGMTFAAMDRYDEAFERFEQAFVEHDNLPMINYTPMLRAGLRQDPRYADLVRRLRLTPAGDLK